MKGPKGKGVSSTNADAPEIFKCELLNSADGDGDSKALATIRARAERCGCSLHELSDGAFLVSRWNYSKAVPCLRAVGDLLRQIGGRP